LKTRYSEMGWGSIPPLSSKQWEYLLRYHMYGVSIPS